MQKFFSENRFIYREIAPETQSQQAMPEIGLDEKEAKLLSDYGISIGEAQGEDGKEYPVTFPAYVTSLEFTDNQGNTSQIAPGTNLVLDDNTKHLIVQEGGVLFSIMALNKDGTQDVISFRKSLKVQAERDGEIKKLNDEARRLAADIVLVKLKGEFPDLLSDKGLFVGPAGPNEVFVNEGNRGEHTLYRFENGRFSCLSSPRPSLTIVEFTDSF